MSKDSKVLYLTGGAILVVAGISYYFYLQGKKTTTIAELPPNDNPTIDENGIPVSTGATLTTITQIAADLYTDMNGYNWTGHDVKPYADAVNLSDIDFVKLYNVFNTKYQPESGQTLTAWFNGETFIFYGSTENSIYQAFQNKLNKLNLK